MQLNLNYNINLESILEDNEAIPPEARAYLSLRSAEVSNRVAHCMPFLLTGAIFELFCG